MRSRVRSTTTRTATPRWSPPRSPDRSSIPGVGVEERACLLGEGAALAPAALRARRWAAAGLWALLLAGLGVSFAPAFAEMWLRWFPAWGDPSLGLYDRLTEGESYYTHAPLVPLVSLLIAHLLIRHTRIPRRPGPVTGWAVLALSGLLHLAGALAGVTFVSGYALLGVLAGGVLVLWGSAALRRLAFPLAFLAFLVPVPEVVLADANFRLRTLAVEWGVGLASAMGADLHHAGGVVTFASGDSLRVANACNGLRTLISLLAFGALYAYVCRLRGAWRFALFALAVPVALAANMARVVALLLVGGTWGATAAAGGIHDLSNALVFLVALGLMFLLERLILLAHRLAGRPLTVLPLLDGVRRDRGERSAWAWMATAPVRGAGVALVLAGGGLAAGTHWVRAATPQRPALTAVDAALPPTLDIDGRTASFQAIPLDPGTERMLPGVRWAYRQYQVPGGPGLHVCAVFGGADRRAIHPPDLCIEGDGREAIAKSDVDVPLPGGGTVPAREIVVRTDGGEMVFLYTYACGDRYTRSYWSQQSAVLAAALLHRDAPGALVRVHTVCEAGGRDAARRRNVEALAAVLTHMHTAPGTAP